MFKLIDANGNGSISKLELIAAVYRYDSVASLVLQGQGSGNPTSSTSVGSLVMNEQSFDAVNDVFEAMAGGGRQVKYADFTSYFRRRAAECLQNMRESQAMFKLIDADGNGAVSKLELVAAMQRSSMVARFLLPDLNCRLVLQDENSYDAVNCLFDSIAAGKQRFLREDFEVYCSRAKATSMLAGSLPAERCSDRSSMRILILAPGFGRDTHPHQGAILVQAGFQVRWCRDLPEHSNTCATATYQAVAPHLGRIREEIQVFKPHVVMCASQGGMFAIGLWQVGYWRGPTIMINAHPSLPMKLPFGMPLVLAHGSNDEVFCWSRQDLEDLIATGCPNKCLLYFTSNSGQLASGSLTRLGDRHVMQSLLSYDCLPRLVDAVMSRVGPEVHLMQTWHEQLSMMRREAERCLGYSSERLRKRWTSPSRRGLDEQKLFLVSPSSEEFRLVASLFRAPPTEPPAYMLSSQESWELIPIHSIERAENGSQLEGSVVPYRDALQRSLEEQGVEFEPGIHTCWAFHGADHEAMMSVIHDPVAGFQPLVSGSRNSAVWGSGTYFARDAKYVADGKFCPRKTDGSRCMLLCLVTLGIACLGDPAHKGNLPFRRKPHRYNSSVDSLSSPEIYVIQHPGAAHAAYLITFA